MAATKMAWPAICCIAGLLGCGSALDDGAPGVGDENPLPDAGAQVDCAATDYEYDESTTVVEGQAAPSRCVDDCQCAGARRCGPRGWCQATREEALEALARPGIIGASVTSGFMVSHPLLEDIEAGIKVPSAPTSHADVLFSRSPIKTGDRLIKDLKNAKPTMIIAADFLFWYVYGCFSNELRPKRLRQGLALLESFNVPMVVGDIPDMGAGDTDRVRSWYEELMLRSKCIPSPQDLKIANDIIADFASERPAMAVIPLAEWREDLRRGTFEVALDDDVSQSFGEDELLLADMLHSNLKGQKIMALLCLNTLRALFPSLDASDLAQHLADF